MKNGLWFCLVWLITGCVPEPNSSDEWDGNYIGYYHKNHQDTTPVLLTFEGKYFAAAPRSDHGKNNSSGVFSQQQSSLIFFNPEADSTAILHGTFQYQLGQDGTIRIWRYPDDGGIVEMILRHK